MIEAQQLSPPPTPLVGNNNLFWGVCSSVSINYLPLNQVIVRLVFNNTVTSLVRKPHRCSTHCVPALSQCRLPTTWIEK